MPTFAWVAKTRAGQVLKGEMEASSKEAVISTLESRELIADKVKERGKGMDLEIKIPGMGGGISGRELSKLRR